MWKNLDTKLQDREVDTMKILCALILTTIWSIAQDNGTTAILLPQSGVFNNTTVNPSVYDEQGKWISNVDNVYVDFLVVDLRTIKNNPAITKECEIEFKTGKQPGSDLRPVGIQAQAKWLALFLTPNGEPYAINNDSESCVIYRLRKVTTTIFQFDPNSRPIQCVNPRLVEAVSKFESPKSE